MLSLWIRQDIKSFHIYSHEFIATQNPYILKGLTAVKYCQLFRLKGSLTRDFRLQVFFMNEFPPIPLGPFQLCTKNSRRYLKVKVCHQYQRHQFVTSINGDKWEKIETGFPYLLRCCSCCLHSFIDFYLMFTLKCRQAHIFASVSSPVSLLPAINYFWCHCYWQ